jgi:hypothetical protein
VGVGIKRNGDGGVSQELLRELRMHVLLKQKRRARVPKVVEAEVWRPAFFRSGVKLRCLRLDGLIGVPASVVKTRP